ncbi:hypothetical protein F7725_004914 [Dissostichus mawsoni]|uniref:SKI/SNO/DAC domain-containing protein n=1 Tax=Dissostichus mawsoni TaxID=36200 RepID=A0A7J5XKE5_DISMA|nr:hypothetical protein F7725_004914 [Dissostichus mawsoni]
MRPNFGFSLPLCPGPSPELLQSGTQQQQHNSHSSHSLSPRLTSSMLSAFLPGPGGSLAGLGSLHTAGLNPGSPGLLQHQNQNSSTLCSECKLVEVHGVKVASFGTDGQELICLPQVFDLFLKHLVGLKRLDIAPVVCTVEQVRVLRGLGAIQPGVNRCKLISKKDFEILYQDCTSARGREVVSCFTYQPTKQRGERHRVKDALSQFSG